MLRWLLDQPMLVQFALVVLPISFVGVLVWAAFGRRGRRLHRAERAARGVLDAARAEGLPVQDCWVFGAVDVSPASLAVIFNVADDATLAAAEATGMAARLRERAVEALRAAGLPATASSIQLVSDETVDREGGAAVYFR